MHAISYTFIIFTVHNRTNFPDFTLINLNMVDLTRTYVGYMMRIGKKEVVNQVFSALHLL